MYSDYNAAGTIKVILNEIIFWSNAKKYGWQDPFLDIVKSISALSAHSVVKGLMGT